MNIPSRKKSHYSSALNNNILTFALSSVHNSLHDLLALIFLLTQTTPPATAQPVLAPPANAELGLAPPEHTPKKSVAGVMMVVVILFFVSGLLSLYTRECVGRRQTPIPILGRLNLAPPIDGGGITGRRLPHAESHGLNSDVIESFPTFLYATVKTLMVAKEALACAVCLEEFQDDETLRLIPNCNHVFHPTCIHPWLASNSTCPVCRTNLVRSSKEEEEEPPFVAVEVPPDDDGHEHQLNYDNDVEAVGAATESPKESVLRRIPSRTMNQNRSTPRSRSTGFLLGLLHPWSESRGHSTTVEQCERRSVRLPEEVRKRLVVNSTLKRAKSCVSFVGMGSERSGYRPTNVGREGGRSNLEWQYERFHGEVQWGFALTPPFFAGSARRSPPVQRSEMASEHRVFSDERSTDHLCAGLLASQGG